MAAESLSALGAAVYETVCMRPGSERWERQSADKAFRFEQNLCPVGGSVAAPPAGMVVRAKLVQAPGSVAATVSDERQFADVIRAVAMSAKGRDHEAFVRHPLIYASTAAVAGEELTPGLRGGDVLTPIADASGRVLPGGMEAARSNPLLLVAPRVLWGNVSIGPMVQSREGDFRFPYPWNAFQPLVGRDTNEFLFRAVQDMFSDYDGHANSMVWMEKQNFSLVRVLRHLGYTDLKRATKVWAQVSFNGVTHHMQVWPKLPQPPAYISRSGEEQYPGAEFLLDVAKAHGEADGVYRMPDVHMAVIVSGVPVPQPPAPGDPQPPLMPEPVDVPSSSQGAGGEGSGGSLFARWWFIGLMVLLGGFVVLQISLAWMRFHQRRRSREAAALAVEPDDFAVGPTSQPQMDDVELPRANYQE